MGIVFGANWKLNPETIDEAKALLDSYALEGLASLVDKELVIFSPSIFLPDLSRYIAEKGYNFRLGAQNVSEHGSGAFSGQLSINMLTHIGITEFLIGHSERRRGYEEQMIQSQNFVIRKVKRSSTELSEDEIKTAEAEAIEYNNEMLNRKIRAVVDYNKRNWEEHRKEVVLPRPLTAFYCVGETLKEKEEERTLNVIGRQLMKGLERLSLDDLQYVVIAYEPRWAIGTGKTASPEDIKEAHAMIRELTRKDVTIVYGGSMKPDTAKEIMAIEGVNGGLIGGASLTAQGFSRIINYDR